MPIPLCPERVTFAVGDAEPRYLNRLPVRPIFDNAVLNFLESLSKVVLSEVEARRFPSVLAFGFWCRRAALLKKKEQYPDAGMRLGRGLAFHVSPSNVPIMFAYTLAAGLLAGNANVVRLPSRALRRSTIRPDASELVFPDRESLLVIQNSAWLHCAQKRRVAEAFYNDTYLTDQASCAAPRLVLWLGGEAEAP